MKLRILSIVMLLIGLTCSAYSFYIPTTSSSHVYVYTMYGDVKDPSKYKALLNLLKTGGTNDVVKLHILGPGGMMDTSSLIANLASQGGPKLEVYVDGPVYSADAVLAFAGDSLYISPNSLFMFHHPIYADETGQELTIAMMCDGDKGKLDRGQDKYKKCVDYTTTGLDSSADLVNRAFKYLSPAEIKAYKDGHDVYITGGEMRKRLIKGGY